MRDDHSTDDHDRTLDDLSFAASYRRDYTEAEVAFMLEVQQAIFASRGEITHAAALTVITGLGLLELNIGTGPVIEVLEQTITSMKAGQSRVN